MPLQAGEVLSFKAGRGVGILCQAGTLWVTQENDPLDHVLHDGERFITGQRGRVVVWAMSDAQVMLGKGAK